MDEKQILAKGICNQIYKIKCKVCNYECKWYKIASNLIETGIVQVPKEGEEKLCNISLT